MTTNRTAHTIALLLVGGITAGCGESSEHHHDGAAGTGGGGAGGGGEAGGGGGGGADGGGTGGASVAHTLYVAAGESLVFFEIATGMQKAGAIANVKTPVDMQVTDAGLVMVNLTDNGEILVVDAGTMVEKARIKSSDIGATRPVHSFITPKIGGKQFWAANNDGAPGMAATNSLRFVDITDGSASYLKAVGEIGLGIGHHKDAWSREKARVSVSNIADCGNVIQIIDYTDVTKPALVGKWSAADLDPMIDCATKGAGPHGAAYAGGHGYHNLTGWGAILSITQDDVAPAFKLLPVDGTGGGYTKAGKDGRYVYSVQSKPREGDVARPGKDCQIGNLVVIDSTTDAIATQAPIFYTSGCASKLAKENSTVGPDHMALSADGKTLFVFSQGTPPTGSMDPYHSDQLQVFDLADPARPVQQESIAVGKHSGHRGGAVTGDGRFLFLVNANAKSISQIEIATRTVTRTLTTADTPIALASYGSAEGPSVQTGPH